MRLWFVILSFHEKDADKQDADDQDADNQDAEDQDGQTGQDGRTDWTKEEWLTPRVGNLGSVTFLCMSVCCGWFGRSVCHNFLRIHMFQFLNVLVNCWCKNWMYLYCLSNIISYFTFFPSLVVFFFIFPFFTLFLLSLFLFSPSLNLLPISIESETFLWMTLPSVRQPVGRLVGWSGCHIFQNDWKVSRQWSSLSCSYWSIWEVQDGGLGRLWTSILF